MLPDAGMSASVCHATSHHLMFGFVSVVLGDRTGPPQPAAINIKLAKVEEIRSLGDSGRNEFITPSIA